MERGVAICPHPLACALVAGLLSHHPLLDPFFASPMLLPVLPRPVKRTRRVRHVLHPFIADPGQPYLDRLSLRAGNGLDETQKRFRISGIGIAHFTIFCNQLQPVTFCNRFTSLFIQAVFQNLPIVSCCLIIRLLDQHLNNIYYREIPCFRILIIYSADFVIFKYSQFD